ncbi:MAG: helix-turn-helix domain-containing protein [Bacteroidota bacterium]
MKNVIPVLQIDSFQKSSEETYFYVNTLSRHLKDNKALISHPHKHDFFLTVFFAKGSGVHEIDFQKFDIQAGSVFLLKPGQTHHWILSPDCEGYIFFHGNNTLQNLHDFPFYSYRQNSPEIKLEKELVSEFNMRFKAIFEEYESNFEFKNRQLFNLIDTLYIDLSRLYEKETIAIQIGKSVYLEQLNKLELLIEKYYKTEKSPAKYAEMLFITPKHVNRIVKECLNKTTSDLISERIILECKRLISHSTKSLTEISRELGFDEFSYFSRFFKKMTGKTLTEFKSEYKSERHQS